MPIIKSRVVLGVARELTAFLNLDVGLTRGKVPNPEQSLWQAQRRVSERERQLEEKNRRLREQRHRLEQAQNQQKQLRETNKKLRASLPRQANKKQGAGGDRERILRMVGGMWEEMGELQFDFLRQQGLKPEHRFLDVGCGILRGGVHFIPYLEPGHYYGIDKNRELLNFGRKEMEKAGLQEQKPTLVQIEDFGFERLGQTFDYALAQSVFTHLPLNYITRCLVNVDRVLKPGGVFFATFFENRGGKQHLDSMVQGGGVISYYDRDPFHYTPDAFEWACEGTSLKAEYIGDWNHPRHQLMLAFRKVEA